MSELNNNKKRNRTLISNSSYSLALDVLGASDTSDTEENNTLTVIKKRSTISNKIVVMKEEVNKVKQNVKNIRVNVPSYIN